MESDLSLNRFNDGKCDEKGRLWIGTLRSGSLYIVEKDLMPAKQLEQLTIYNGMAWKEDNQTFYIIDMPTLLIKGYHYDMETGEIEFKQIAFEIPEELGFPDGMCIDSEVMLWVPQYGGARVYRWNSLKGKLIEKIKMPVPHITSCAFGKENLDMLSITTSQENISRAHLKERPMSGDGCTIDKNDNSEFEANQFLH